MSLNRNLKYWVPVIIWMAFIFWMSTDTFSAQHTLRVIEHLLRLVIPSISPKGIALVHEIIRKLAHVTEYFISGLLIFRAFRGGLREGKAWHWASLSVVFIILLAASDEYHQSYVASRTSSIVDVGIDTVGGILAQCFSLLLYYRRRGQPHSSPS